MKFNTKTSFHIWFCTGNNSLWKQHVDIQFNIASFWGPLSLKYIPLFRCCAAFYSLHSLLRAYSKFAPSDTCFAMRHWRKSSANSFSGIFNEKFRKCLMKLFLLYYCKLYCHHNLKGGEALICKADLGGSPWCRPAPSQCSPQWTLNTVTSQPFKTFLFDLF